MKRSDNLSKKTTVSVTQKKSSTPSKKSPARSGKPSGKKKSGSKKTPELKLSYVTSLRPTKKPHHSNRNIGIKAQGHYIKTLYGVTEGKTGEKEYEALKHGLKQMQNLVNKRIDKLLKLEKETGMTSPALQDLRETGYGKGVSLRGYGTDTDSLRDQYKAMIEFLKDKTSTREGVIRNMLDIEADLRKVGWRPEGEKEGADYDNLTVHLSGDEYEKFKALAKKFYDEQTKWQFYQITGTHDQDALREAANKEIMELLDKGDLKTVLDMADDRMNEMYWNLQEQKAQRNKDTF